MRTLASRSPRPSMWRTCIERIWMAGLTIVVTSSLLAGCATTKAAAIDVGPPLAVPVAPQRVIVPAEEEPLASTSNGLDRPLASVPQVQSPTPTTTSRRASAPRPDPDNRNEAASSAGVAAAAAGTLPEATRDQRPLSSAELSIQARVTAYLNRATADLKCVDPSKLSTERKAIYNEWKRHADAANERMKERQFIFAESAAEKAAAFAANLATPCTNR